MNLLDLARSALPASCATLAVTPDQAAELRELVAIVAADWPEAERAEALAVALADAESALVCFRALAKERQAPAAPEPVGDSGMRSCRECANLAPSGRCLAAWRGESFGVGVAVSRRYAPATDWPQRCGAYAPGPDDPDRRSGRERWPFLYREAIK